MHKSIFIAVVAIFLIASPYMMFGTLNSNMFSNAMAIKEGGSESSIIVNSDASEEQVKSSDISSEESSDDEKDESSVNDEKDDSSSDDEKDDSSSDDEKDESSVKSSAKSSDD